MKYILLSHPLHKINTYFSTLQEKCIKTIHIVNIAIIIYFVVPVTLLYRLLCYTGYFVIPVVPVDPNPPSPRSDEFNSDSGTNTTNTGQSDG